MKNVFVICNQQNLFLGKQGQWVDESEPAQVYRTPHHDVALNHLIEVNARDIEQRLVLMQCPLNDRDVPLLGDAEVPRKVAPVTYDEPEVQEAADPEAADPDDMAVTSDDSAVVESSYAGE